MAHPFQTLLHRWRSNERGSIAVVFAVLLLPLMTIIALVIDYADSSRERERLRSAVTSAASMLAGDKGIENLSPALTRLRARDYVTGVDKRIDLSKVTFKVTISEERVRVAAHTEVAQPIGALVGRPSRAVQISATARRRNKPDTEGASDGELRDDDIRHSQSFPSRFEFPPPPPPMPFRMIEPPRLPSPYGF